MATGEVKTLRRLLRVVAVKRALRTAGAVMVGLALSVGLWYAFPAPTHLRFVQVAVATNDILDPADPSVAAAHFQATFVQWGTTQPYTGNLAPGVDLLVTNAPDMTQWTLEAWLNNTTPPAVRVCTNSTVHFSPYDWTFHSQGVTNGGAWSSTPSTVWQRLGPSGDQCFMRAQETGVWNERVCIEGKPGGPRFYHREADGMHYDAWDYCYDTNVTV